jgi:hypothetical protein
METVLRRALYDAFQTPKRIYTSEEKERIKVKKAEDAKREKKIQKMMRDQEIKQGWRFKNHYTEEDTLKARRAADADPYYDPYSGRTDQQTPIQRVFEAQQK